MVANDRVPKTRFERRKAVQETGLEWTTIYKWVFDNAESIYRRQICKQFANRKIFTVTKVKKRPLISSAKTSDDRLNNYADLFKSDLN